MTGRRVPCAWAVSMRRPGPVAQPQHRQVRRPAPRRFAPDGQSSTEVAQGGGAARARAQMAHARLVASCRSPCVAWPPLGGATVKWPSQPPVIYREDNRGFADTPGPPARRRLPRRPRSSRGSRHCRDRQDGHGDPPSRTPCRSPNPEPRPSAAADLQQLTGQLLAPPSRPATRGHYRDLRAVRPGYLHSQGRMGYNQIAGPDQRRFFVEQAVKATAATYQANAFFDRAAEFFLGRAGMDRRQRARHRRRLPCREPRRPDGAPAARAAASGLGHPQQLPVGPHGGRLSLRLGGPAGGGARLAGRRRGRHTGTGTSWWTRPRTYLRSRSGRWPRPSRQTEA